MLIERNKANNRNRMPGFSTNCRGTLSLNFKGEKLKQSYACLVRTLLETILQSDSILV